MLVLVGMKHKQGKDAKAIGATRRKRCSGCGELDTYAWQRSFGLPDIEYLICTRCGWNRGTRTHRKEK